PRIAGRPRRMSGQPCLQPLVPSRIPELVPRRRPGYTPFASRSEFGARGGRVPRERGRAPSLRGACPLSRRHPGNRLIRSPLHRPRERGLAPSLSRCLSPFPATSREPSHALHSAPAEGKGTGSESSRCLSPFPETSREPSHALHSAPILLL